MVRLCAVYLGAVKTQFSDAHPATSGMAEAWIGKSTSASLLASTGDIVVRTAAA